MWGEHKQEQWGNIQNSYICHGEGEEECGEVFRYAPRGVCPRCSSRNIQPLSWLVRPVEERRDWLEKINNKGSWLGLLRRRRHWTLPKTGGSEAAGKEE